MKQGKRKNWVLLLVIASLLVNAVMTTPVLADDSLPPPSETTEESAPPQETSGEEASQEPSSSEAGEGTSAEESSEEPTSTDEGTTTEEEPAASEVSAEEGSEEPASSETPAEETSVAEVLAEVPAGTEVVVLDEGGEAVPLATEEAAEIVYAGDPIWCPAGVAVPTPSQNGCSPSFTYFTGGGGLLEWLTATNPAKAGVVWIEKTYNSNTAGDGNVVFDGTILTNMANFSLTLKGGWNGLGTGTVDVSDRSEFIGDSLSIINWKGNVTLSHILVVDAVTGPCGAALCVDTAGSIKLVGVTAFGNDGTLDGASLDNRRSTTSGSVTVIGGSYSQNYRYGLAINTKGAVTLKDVFANSNSHGTGVYINNAWDAAASAVSITNGLFSNNQDASHGLVVLSNGNVTLANIRATTNASSGVHINNTYGSGNVALNGTNIFFGNLTDGLSIVSDGNVIARHLVSNGNGANGVLIDNRLSPAPKAVTLSGSGLFVDNAVTGLAILSSGAVTLNNLTAVDNDNSGVTIENHGFTLGAVAAPVRINGINTFSGNAGNGLYVDSDGAILLSRVTADSNGFGVFLNNSTPDNGPQNVTVLGYLNAVKSTAQGVFIRSHGAITIANLTASHNGWEGAVLHNASGNAPRNITLTGMNAVIYNQNDGLHIDSRGAVTLSNVTAIGNGRVPNLAGTYTGGDYNGVTIFNNYEPGVQKNVTFTGTNVFNANGLHGLYVGSYGAILLSNVTANRNGHFDGGLDGNGVQLDNRFGTLVKPVTLSGVSLFENNNEYGLLVNSDGAITVSKVTATFNGKSGAFLLNDTAKAQSRVTILGYGMFDSNLDEGLKVYSNGAITTYNLTSNRNANGGVLLATIGLTAPQAVTLNGTNSFNQNGYYGCSPHNLFCSKSGLYVEADGNITLNNVTANGNSNGGVFLINDTSLFDTFGSVFIKGYGNISNTAFGNGLFVRSLGNATFARLNVHSNGINPYNGIELQVDGHVSLACSTAYNNGLEDLLVTSSDGMGPAKSVTLTGYAFNYNINALATSIKPCP